MNAARENMTSDSEFEALLDRIAASLRDEYQVECENLDVLIARVDYLARLYERQIHEIVNRILHHPRFQQLESTYRALNWLTSVMQTERVRICVLDITAAELKDDLDAGYRRSNLYQKIYVDRFDTPFGAADIGDPKAVGYPFGLLVADYDFSEFVQKRNDGEQVSAGNTIDISVLRELANLGRDSFCPVVCGVSSDVFGIDSFAELEYVQDLVEVFESKMRMAWQMFRRAEEQGNGDAPASIRRVRGLLNPLANEADRFAQKAIEALR